MKKYEINEQTIPKGIEKNTEQENEKIVLWRYISFSSLCEILRYDRIPLISASIFPDKSEGSILREILKTRKNTYPYSVDIAMQELLKMTYISSWHVSENENAAMWDRYTYGGEGVAIKTNAKLLVGSIQSDKNQLLPIVEPKDIMRISQSNDGNHITIHTGCIIRPIIYTNIDPQNFEMEDELLENGYDKMCFFYKMIDFKDESEVRILSSNMTDVEKMAQLKKSEIDEQIRDQYDHRQKFKMKKVTQLRIQSAQQLIQEVVVSPHANEGFIDIVEQTISSIGYTKNLVNTSEDL